MHRTINDLDQLVSAKIQKEMIDKKKGKAESIRNLKYAMKNHAKKDLEGLAAQKK
jgi:hypothetical protein